MDDSGRVLLESETVERILFNPATPGIEHEPWPFAGIQIEGEPPARTRVPTQVVQRGVAEGWIKITGEKVVHRPGGSFVNPWAITHTFVHLDTVTFCTVDGDVSCKVTQNPDKWPDRKDGELGFGGDVLWFYELEREG